jgi:hypothetical protein
LQSEEQKLEIGIWAAGVHIKDKTRPISRESAAMGIWYGVRKESG